MSVVWIELKIEQTFLLQNANTMQSSPGFGGVCCRLEIWIGLKSWQPDCICGSFQGNHFLCAFSQERWTGCFMGNAACQLRATLPVEFRGGWELALVQMKTMTKILSKSQGAATAQSHGSTPKTQALPYSPWVSDTLGMLIPSKSHDMEHLSKAQRTLYIINGWKIPAVSGRLAWQYRSSAALGSAMLYSFGV